MIYIKLRTSFGYRRTCSAQRPIKVSRSVICVATSVRIFKRTQVCSHTATFMNYDVINANKSLILLVYILIYSQHKYKYKQRLIHTLNAMSVNENSMEAVKSWLASIYVILACAKSHWGCEVEFDDHILPGIPVGVFRYILNVPTFLNKILFFVSPFNKGLA